MSFAEWRALADAKEAEDAAYGMFPIKNQDA
jgi:hypothetical protein